MSSLVNNLSVEGEDLPETGNNSENFDAKSEHEDPLEQQQQHPEDDRESLSSDEGSIASNYEVKLIFNYDNTATKP
jgi:hypothetical protein